MAENRIRSINTPLLVIPSQNRRMDWVWLEQASCVMTLSEKIGRNRTLRSVLLKKAEESLNAESLMAEQILLNIHARH